MTPYSIFKQWQQPNDMKNREWKRRDKQKKAKHLKNQTYTVSKEKRKKKNKIDYIYSGDVIIHLDNDFSVFNNRSRKFFYRKVC